MEEPCSSNAVEDELEHPPSVNTDKINTIIIFLDTSTTYSTSPFT
ncbi:hypothetical protein NYE80_22195 [Paenibacillus sp. FSL H7-0357]